MYRLKDFAILFPYIRARWKLALVTACLLLALSLLALPYPYLMKIIIDNGVMGKNPRVLNLMILLILCTLIVKAFLSIMNGYFSAKFNQEIIASIKKDLIQKLLRLPIVFFDNQQSSYLVSRVSEVEGVGFLFSNSSVRIIISFFELIFCLAILLRLNWELTLVALAVLPVYYFTSRAFQGRMRKLSYEFAEKTAVLSQKIQDSLQGADLIKVFTAEERETEKICSYLDSLRLSNMKRSVIYGLSSEFLSLIGALGGLLVLWFSGVHIIKGTFTLGTYIAFSGYLANLYGPTQMLATLQFNIVPALTSLERLNEIYNYESEGRLGSMVKMGPIQGNIEFSHVCFSYGREPVLKDVCFDIRAGEKVLLAGPNGAGKTTILKLLLRLYDIQCGAILVDGNDVRQIGLSNLRERFSIVSQNVFLFNASIRSNILFSQPHAQEEEFLEAARQSGVADFVKKYERGFETEVGERAIRLSGGEKQKIAIARAILKDADIMLLDETTTHLDRVSANRLIQLIKQKFAKKTCLIVGHDKVFYPLIDKVLTLDHGAVTDSRRTGRLAASNKVTGGPG